MSIGRVKLAVLSRTACTRGEGAPSSGHPAAVASHSFPWQRTWMGKPVALGVCDCDGEDDDDGVKLAACDDVPDTLALLEAVPERDAVLLGDPEALRLCVPVLLRVWEGLRVTLCVAECVVLGVRVGVTRCDGVDERDREPVRDWDGVRVDVCDLVSVTLGDWLRETLGAQATLIA